MRTDAALATGSGCDAAGAITTAAECFQAAAKELALIRNGLSVTNTSINREDRPRGCSVASDGVGASAATAEVTVMFNHAPSGGGSCGNGETFRAGQTRSLAGLAGGLAHWRESTRND